MRSLASAIALAAFLAALTGTGAIAQKHKAPVKTKHATTVACSQCPSKGAKKGAKGTKNACTCGCSKSGKGCK